MQQCVTVRSCQKNLQLLLLSPTRSPTPPVAAKLEVTLTGGSKTAANMVSDNKVGEEQCLQFFMRPRHKDAVFHLLEALIAKTDTNWCLVYNIRRTSYNVQSQGCDYAPDNAPDPPALVT